MTPGDIDHILLHQNVAREDPLEMDATYVWGYPRT
jgi:hypothetical protein